MTSRDIIQFAMTMHLEALPAILFFVAVAMYSTASVIYGCWFVQFPIVKRARAAGVERFYHAISSNDPISIPESPGDGRLQQCLESLFQFHPNAIWVLDNSRRIRKVNPSLERVLGYSLADINDTDPGLLEVPQYGIIRKLVDDAVYSGRANEEISCILRHKDGRSIQCRLTTIPIFVDAQTDGCYVLLRDVTLESQSVASLHKADKLATVGELAAGMAHEIRNPLTSILGFLKLIQEQGQVPRYFQIIKEELAHIELICSEFLVLSRPQVKQYRAIQLPSVIADVAASLTCYASRFGVELKVDIKKPRTWIMGQENELKQVCINVIRNAIEAMPGGGTVDIVLSDNETQAILLIKDSGVGMTDLVLSHLGEPFYSTKGHGIGLGLMITHRIVEQNAGEIHYESEPGKGTTVRISFDKQQHLLQKASDW